MATGASIRIVGDWQQEIHVGLSDVLRVSMDTMRRTGTEACKHALILMAQSARKMTPKSPARREVKTDMRLHGAEYVEVYNQGSGEPTRLYRFRFSDKANPKDRIPGTWDSAKKIHNRGLAARSWMWGLGAVTGKGPIRGASRVYEIMRSNVSGWVKENRLPYVSKIMPGGWEAAAQQSAENRILAQAAVKIEREIPQSVEAMGWRRHKR